MRPRVPLGCLRSRPHAGRPSALLACAISTLRLLTWLPAISLAVDPVAALDPGPAPVWSDLGWPTDAGRCVTSSYCEFRPGHFHSGIDISTGGKVGFRCLAADDGEIERARVSCGGYGRALYLRTTDGRVVVYAHLSRFAGALADTVPDLQMAAGSAYFDREFPPGTFPVRRGEVIAYTGQSGVGVPHLHVEIRDPDQNPLDPLVSGLTVPDTRPPFVTRVSLTPLTPLSSVDGRSDTVILDVHPADGPGDRGWIDHIPRVIPVEGQIGISLEVDEAHDTCHRRLAPHRLELREGDELLFAVEYGRFDFALSTLSDFQIDPRFSYGKVGHFHHLWRRPGNDLPFSPGAWKTDGVIRAGHVPFAMRAPLREPDPEGEARPEARIHTPSLESVQEPGETIRELTCVVVDAAGNRGAVALNLSFAAPPSVAVLSVERSRAVAAALDSVTADLEGTWVDTLLVDGGLREPGRPVHRVDLDLSFDGGATWQTAPPAIPHPDLSFHARIPVPRSVPGEGGRSVVVRAQPVDALGARGIAVSMAPYGAQAPPTAPARLEVVTLGPWAEVRLDEHVPFSAVTGGWEVRRGADGAPEELSAIRVRSWGRGIRIVTVSGPSPDLERHWSGTGPEWRGYDPWGRPVPLHFRLPPRLTPESGGRVGDPNGLAEFRLPPGTLREPALPRVREEPPSLPAGELRPLGPLYALETGHVPLAGDYELVLRPSDDAVAGAAPGAVTPDSGGVGIFVQTDDRFRYIGGEAAPDGAGWVATARTPLPVGLFEDRVPPTLGEPRLEEWHGRPRLVFHAEDSGAGIDCDAVEVRADGVPVPHELDDETGDVVAYPPVRAVSGEGGLFEIRVVDRCGNSSHRRDEVRFP
jgi:hypothetical protein